ncbi:NAD-dependent epimerase/dehydratase family protein [Streptomyces sp. NPDC002896]|uniref:NAD-dependent epimerase/dehydratase family protein n=1 Tax=Streptomyces sp. NPDC002896 TaxID=3154438 RepID=UPI003317407C
MATVFITGGTGLIGANICRRLRERGDEVRALVRPGSAYEPLRELGVVPVEGDITSGEEVLAAAKDAEFTVHSAAVLGGASQDLEEHARVNTLGLRHVLDAAAAVGCRRTVALGTTTYFDYTTAPLTEDSPLLDDPPSDPYTVSKRAAFVELMRRARDGQDACVVIPGGTFGPSPVSGRAMQAPSYNLRIKLALERAIAATVYFPIPWSYADDVAAVTVAALDRGIAGEKYLAFASPDDVCSTAQFLNRACELAGSDHRVVDLTAKELDADPQLQRANGPSLVALAHRRFPEPYYTDTLTRARLGHTPLRLEEGLRRTLAWLEDTGALESGGAPR